MTRGGSAHDRRAFATSGSLLVIFVGLFIGIGTLYTATANSWERVSDAREDTRQGHRAIQDTQVNVTEATWDTGTSNLTVKVNNTGDRVLRVPNADTVVDGTYVPISDYERVEVEGQDSDVWRPGEQLVLEDEDTATTFDATPGRVKFVTETAVADVAEVQNA